MLADGGVYVEAIANEYDDNVTLLYARAAGNDRHVVHRPQPESRRLPRTAVATWKTAHRVQLQPRRRHRHLGRDGLKLEGMA